MQNKLEKLQHEFEGFEFVYQEAPHLAKKTFKGLQVSIIGDKFKIEADKRTFLVHNSEVESFMQKVTFTGATSNLLIHPKRTEVANITSVCSDIEIVSDGLMAMFDKIKKDTVSKEEIEKAKVMTGLAGKIIDIEKVNLGYLALSRK